MSNQMAHRHEIEEGNSSEMSEQIGMLLEEVSSSDHHVDNSLSAKQSCGSKVRSPAADINWALTYSSDEDSQNSRGDRPTIRRSYSDPSMEESIQILNETPTRMGNQETRRRTRSTDGQEESSPTTMESNDDENIEKRRRQHFWTRLRAIAFCTPVRWLFVLFVLTCYTTFWLPYPNIRPTETTIPNIRMVKLPKVADGSLSIYNPNNTMKGKSAPLLHARAAAELELTYLQPGLDNYYKQEGFSNHAWTKYANVGVLSGVLVWAVYEHRRRGESSTVLQ